jgi:alkaline phosphatase
VYNWHPTVLAKANASAQYLAHKLHEHISSIKSDPAALEDLEDWINTKLVIPGLGITDARESELKELASDPEHAIYTLSRMISQRARIGWSTHGHSAVDVNIYSSGGRLAEDIHGNVENTEVGQFLRKYLDVDVDKITDELREKMAWNQSLATSADSTIRVGYEAEEPMMDWIN